MFLITEDYSPYIRTSIKDDILLGQTSLIKKVELAAQAEMSSYLNDRYDVTKVFIDIMPYHADLQYNAGAYIYDAGNIYKALEAITGVQPSVEIEEEDSRVSLEDPRNPIIVLRMVYITLYHAHKSLPGSQIPQLRIDDYDISLKWLRDVATGVINPLLPEAVREDNAIVAYGSEERRVVRW